MNPNELIKYEQQGYKLVFDLDNTIYDENIFLKWCFKKISELYPNSQDVYFFLAYTFSKSGRINLFDKLIKKFGDCGYNDPISNFLNVYRNFNGDLEFNQWFYDYMLQTKCDSIFIITNGNLMQQKTKISNLKFQKKTNVIYASQYSCKPDSISLHKLLPDYKNHKIIYIGDSYVDFKFALNCGVSFIHTNKFLTFIK